MVIELLEARCEMVWGWDVSGGTSFSRAPILSWVLPLGTPPGSQWRAEKDFLMALAGAG